MPVKVYDGTNWVTVAGDGAQGATGASGTAPLTTKGDLLGFDTAANRVAVGTDGQSLVADSSATTGVRWQDTYAAGKNALINGALDFAQRGTTHTTIGGFAYTLDRYITRTSAGAGSVVTTQELTNDATNLPSIKYCARLRRSTGNTSTSSLQFSQAIESSNSIQFVGSKVTLSFYARKSTNFSGTSFSANILSGTGTDQSLPVTFTGAAVIGTSSITLTTTWTRYTITTSAVVASTVKQLGFYMAYEGVGTAAADDYFEVTGIQLEMGSVATTFSRNSGTIQGELAACSRYFRIVSSANGVGLSSTTQIQSSISHPGMRTTPSVALTAVATFTDCAVADYTQSSATMTISNNDADGGRYQASNFTGITSLRAYILLSSGGKVQLSAEL